MQFNNVFHLSGTYFTNWAHFLIQFYPKLEFISKIDNTMQLSILIPVDADPHIKFMIDNACRDFNNISIIEVDRDVELFCKNLFYTKIDSYLGDIGEIHTPFHVQVADSTVKYLKSSVQNLLPLNSNKYRKIYIGRDGVRGLENEDEIFQLFKACGFEKIYPHKLGFLEKIKIFSEATHIVGPQSSGFMNIIFCGKGARILVFINGSRHDDMLLTKIAEYNEFECLHFLGRQLDSSDENSKYKIESGELKLFLKNYEFN
jgi:capsular polysaccharide biosynthesis protein